MLHDDLKPSTFCRSLEGCVGLFGEKDDALEARARNPGQVAINETLPDQFGCQSPLRLAQDN
jgi:hypothetical protein